MITIGDERNSIKDFDLCGVNGDCVNQRWEHWIRNIDTVHAAGSGRNYCRLQPKIHCDVARIARQIKLTKHDWKVEVGRIDDR